MRRAAGGVLPDQPHLSKTPLARVVYLADEQTLDVAFDGIEQAMHMSPHESGIGAALHV